MHCDFITCVFHTTDRDQYNTECREGVIIQITVISLFQQNHTTSLLCLKQVFLEYTLCTLSCGSDIIHNDICI